MQPRIAIFPGSFDPFTLGHHDVVLRALPLFDKIVIAIGQNSTKAKLFSEELMQQKLRELYKNEPKIAVTVYQELTVAFAKKQGAQFILRGIRNSMDLHYESPIAQTNKKMEADIETVFLLTAPEHAMINSTIVREIYKTGRDISPFLPFAL